MRAQQGETLPAVAARAQALTAFDRAIELESEHGPAFLGRGETIVEQADQMAATGFATEATTALEAAKSALREAERLGPATVRARASELLDRLRKARR